MTELTAALENIQKKMNDEESACELEVIEQMTQLLTTKKGIKSLISKESYTHALKDLRYEKEIQALQVELIKLQNWVYENNKRVLILFEGRDAAGKGGAIKRFTEYLNPRKYRTVALPKPSEMESGQFYFQRYMKELPNPGEIAFFDRSWYNRAVVEPAFGFCTTDQYEKFMREVVEIEHALIDDGIILIKFWYSVSKEAQKERFSERMNNPLKHWKLSPIDKKAQEMWDIITHYKEEMFSKSHTLTSPWIIVNANNKKKARIESIRYVLSQISYDGKQNAKVSLAYDPEVIARYHRKTKQIDS